MTASTHSPVAEIGAALHALADEADPVVVGERPLVERVDLELEPVEPELDEQQPLELPRRVVCDSAAAEVRMHGETLQPRDPVRLVDDVEAESPRALAVDLDDEAAELLRLALRARHLLGQRRTVELGPGAEERTDVLAGDELREEVDVVGPGAPDGDAAHASEASDRRRRRDGRSAPVPSPTPRSTSTRPPIAMPAIGSPRKIAP